MNAKNTERHPIADNLREARLRAGFESVSDAARHIGLPIPTAVAHEGAGASFRRPKLEMLRRYAEAYHTTIDQLEFGSAEIVQPPLKASVAYQLVGVALQGEFGDQHVMLKVPTNFKVGDNVTVTGTISGVVRKHLVERQ